VFSIRTSCKSSLSCHDTLTIKVSTRSLIYPRASFLREEKPKGVDHAMQSFDNLCRP
jgi:hypothetical protein